jgi:putative two-component system response regulator
MATGADLMIAGPRILVVDDVEQNRVLLAALVRTFGYAVETASDGVEALAKVADGIDLVLLDVMMPGIDGYEVTRRVRADHTTRDLPIILVTTLSSREDRLQAVAAGASDFITKPVERTELLLRVTTQLRAKAAMDELRRAQAALEEQVARRTDELREACEVALAARHRSDAAHLDTIRRLVLAAEAKDPDTARHVLLLAAYSSVLAKALNLPASDSEALGYAVMMHDIGKVGIPDAILFKRGPLNPEERRTMESHTVIGGRLLADSSSELIRHGQAVALTHHERWDGAGYPRGLAGEEIPLAGRICSVVEVFDAMTTPRLYRAAVSPHEALDEMRRRRGRHFQPQLFDLFVDRLPEVLELRQQLSTPTAS